MSLSQDQLIALQEARESTQPTRRSVAPGMEKHLFIPYPVLDHGFVTAVDYMGDDSAIVQAARVSYGAGTKHTKDEGGLIRYLMRHHHSTPFEMCEIKLHVKLPVFVARQWIRHRTANVNEYSARYSILDNEFYIPDANQMAKQSAINNQGRGELLDPERAEVVRRMLIEDAARSYDHYIENIRPEAMGGDNLARELARMNLPANIYTQWYWKTDLHNLFRFIKLRADSHAQYEIRVYAEELAKIVKDWVPQAYRAFKDYSLNAETLSGPSLRYLQHVLKDIAIDVLDEDEAKLFLPNDRERREFMALFRKL